jgi:keratin, type II cytoskeletal I (fragment)
MGPQQSGMGMGMNSGMGGMGMGIGMGMHGGYGMNRMGIGGMGMQGGSVPGANPAMGRVQCVSTAALNAAAAEQIVGPDGKAISPLKMYAKDMIVVLVITPVLLTLAITGVLTDLGFLIGKLIADTVSGIGGMI